MRITLVHKVHAATGGTERYLDLLAAHLARRGHGVEVLCRRHGEAPHPGVRFRRLRPTAVGGAWKMWAFARAVEAWVERNPSDVVYGLGKTWTHDVVRLGGGCHGTYLAQAHAATRTRLDRLLGRGALKHRLALRIEERALTGPRVQTVICNAEGVRRDVLGRYPLAPERVVTIHNGVDLERFHPRWRASGGSDVRRRLGLEAQDQLVLFLGTGYGRKGLDLLLDAAARVFPRRDRAHLAVVGYDGARSRFEARAASLGLGDRVHFVGGTREAEAWYGAADLYVLPTRYDPFANSTLEALACGVPVITTFTNGGSELLDEGVQGSVVKPEVEALERALTDWTEPGRAEAARGAARARAEEHGIESKLEATEEILGVIARRAGGA